MCLLLLLWRLAAEGGADLLSRNSRFGEFNSRLSRYGRLRELAGNGLIWLAVFAPESLRNERNRRNSRFYGNNREFCPPLTRAASRGGSGRCRPSRSRLRAPHRRCGGGSASARPFR